MSVQVTTKSGSFNIGGDATAFDVINRLDAILEMRVGDYEEGYSNPSLIGN